MIFEIANQTVKITFEKNNNDRHQILENAAKQYKAPEKSIPDFEINITYKNDLEEKLKKHPSGPVRLNSNPTNTASVLSSNKFISRISWHEKLMIVSIDARFTQPDLLVLENVKLLIALLCIQKGGLPCHSSALYKNDTAIAFVGGSGSGKSTIATIMSKTWNLVDDDFNIFLPERGAFYVHTTPFYLLSKFQINSQTSPPINLKKIFILKKSILTKMSPISSKDKYIIIMGNTFAFPMSDHFAQIMLENCQRLCETTPISNLFFTKTDDITLKIDGFLQESAAS